MNTSFYLVQMLGVVATFGLPVLIVLFVLLFTYLGKKRKYHLAEVMVEKGQPLPESFFERKRKDCMPSSIKLLQNGLIFIAVGIGTALFAWSQNSMELLAISSIPALMGIAYLIVSFVVKKKEKEEIEKTGEQEN